MTPGLRALGLCALAGLCLGAASSPAMAQSLEHPPRPEPPTPPPAAPTPAPSLDLGAWALCVVVGDDPGAGLEVASLDRAWRIALRKNGRSGTLAVVARAASCSPAAHAVAKVGDGPAALAQIRAAWPGAETLEVPLDGLDPSERPALIAREASDLLAAGPDEPVSFGELLTPPPPPPTLPPLPAPHTLVQLSLAGTYAAQAGVGAHRGGVDAAVSVAIVDATLLVGLRVGWMPAQALQGAAVPTTLETLTTALELGVIWPALSEDAPLPVDLRAAAGGVAQWRRLAVSPETRLDSLRYDDVQVGVVARVGLGTRLVATPDTAGRGGLGLALDALVRAFPDGESRSWLGDPVYEAPVLQGLVRLELSWGWALGSP